MCEYPFRTRRQTTLDTTTNDIGYNDRRHWIQRQTALDTTTKRHGMHREFEVHKPAVEPVRMRSEMVMGVGGAFDIVWSEKGLRITPHFFPFLLHFVAYTKGILLNFCSSDFSDSLWVVFWFVLTHDPASKPSYRTTGESLVLVLGQSLTIQRCTELPK